MLLMLLEKGYPLDYIVSCDTGKEFPEMYAHIEKVKQYLKERFPDAPEITTLRAEHSFDYFMFEIPVKRKFDTTDSRYNKYQSSCGYGWGSFKNRWCTSRMKTRVMEKFFKDVGEYVNYIGIAADEPKRLKADKRKIYPLAEWGISERAALNFCYQRRFDWGGGVQAHKPHELLVLPLAVNQIISGVVEVSPRIVAGTQKHGRAVADCHVYELYAR